MPVPKDGPEVGASMTIPSYRNANALPSFAAHTAHWTVPVKMVGPVPPTTMTVRMWFVRVPQDTREIIAKFKSVTATVAN